MRHFDVRTTFLESVMEEEIFITLPKKTEIADENTVLVGALKHQTHD